MSPAERFDFNEPLNEHCVSINIYEGGYRSSLKESSFYGIKGLEDSGIDMFGCGKDFLGIQDNAAELELAMFEQQNYPQLQQFAEFGNFDDLRLDVVSPPFQSCDDEIRNLIAVIEPQNEGLTESNKRRSYISPLESFEILRKHGIRRPRVEGNKLNIGCDVQSSKDITPMMSTHTIIELAAEKFIHSSSIHPYPTSILGHSEEDSTGVQLVQDLLSCAEKVGEKMYQRATKLLHQCHKMSSCTGTPIQRIVFYFTEALYEKIDRETGRITPKGLGKKYEDPLKVLNCTDLSLIIAFYKKHPFFQTSKFSGIQAIVDHVEEASNVHVIDLEIRSGIHCTILMQALATRNKRPIHHLKITALGNKSNHTLQDTGRRLTSFAQSLNLKFSFNTVLVEDMLDLNKNLFDLDEDEALAVNAQYTLTSMIGRADRLEHVMNVIRGINPCIMIVTEIEANCNSPNFVERFVEALFFYSAFFDSMAECMKNDEKNRRDAESMLFSASIRNVLAAEGQERKIRHVSISVWRAFFARFGLVETELSMSSLYQANLVLQRFAYGSSCTLDMNGKCLTMNWKGTPLCSLSAWKFQRNSIDES